ncbi:MAG: hypothetical protein KDD25_08895, partial [Bdellovibrionales bacterium]|nr:hypothetical protein [Bdellovibrionales bacterium]
TGQSDPGDVNSIPSPNPTTTTTTMTIPTPTIPPDAGGNDVGKLGVGGGKNLEGNRLKGGCGFKAQSIAQDNLKGGSMESMVWGGIFFVIFMMPVLLALLVRIRIGETR